MKRRIDGNTGSPPAPPAGEDLQNAFGVQVGQVARRWRALLDMRLKEYGLTEATWRPLLHLSKFTAPPRQTDLAESLSIEGPSLVRLLDRLERDGYILRCADSDRRTKIIRLTPRGEALQKKIAAVVADTRDQLLAGVAEWRLAAAIEVLEEVQRSIAALSASTVPGAQPSLKPQRRSRPRR